MTIYKVGDMVIRDNGSWRGVSPGDVHEVAEVHGGNIRLVDFDGITFDGGNFSLYQSAGAPQVSLDEAVSLCKDARNKIKELEDKVKSLKDSIKAYERVIRNAGLTFI